MSVRYRRKRVLLLFIATIIVTTYWINKRSYRVDVDQTQEHESKSRSDPNEPTYRTASTSTTLSSSLRSVRTKIVEINGEKLRKIDWHDYESMARENARTGTHINRIRFVNIYVEYRLD
jgi:hypothetical protein